MNAELTIYDVIRSGMLESTEIFAMARGLVKVTLSLIRVNGGMMKGTLSHVRVRV